MRTVQVNWGWPPRQTGGPIGYVADLSRELVRLGHQVFVFYAGDTDITGRCRVKRRQEEGVELVSCLNSPNNFLPSGLPLRECREAETEGIFRRFLAEIKPDLVHVHSLLGLSGSILEIPNSMGIRSVVSLHNYWFVCPRVDLLRPPSYSLCPGPDQGLNCSLCAPRAGLRELRRARLKGAWKNVIKGRPALKRFLQRNLLGVNKLRRSLLDLEKKGIESLPPEEPDPALAEEYLFREVYLRDLLVQKVDLLIAVSNYVKDRFIEHGIPQEKIAVVHSGIRSRDRLMEFARREPGALHDPLTFGFFGPVLPYKGVHVLVEAFNHLPPSSARLRIYGSGDSKYLLQLMKKANGSVHFGGAFKNLTDILPEFDVTVVPPIWHDNAPLVVLESLASGKPIIGADIGGIPDFVQNGINGLLFTPGDPLDLAGKMRKLLESPQLTASLRENIKPPKSMTEHARELSEVYMEQVTSKVGKRGHGLAVSCFG